LLKKAKEKGYFLICIHVLTSDYKINIAGVAMMESREGHGVPKEKIKSRYYNVLGLVSELVEICGIVHICDNTIVIRLKNIQY
jgi:predicted ABC-type ATPase